MARRYEEDPIAYRIAYSRVTQTLHLATEGKGKGMPSTRVDKAVEKLVASEPIGGQDQLAGDAMREALELIEHTRAKLVRLGWEWIGWVPSKRRRKRAIKDCGGLPGITRPGKRRKHIKEARELAEFLDQVVEPATVVLYYSARVRARGYDSSLFLAEESSVPLGRRGVHLDAQQDASASPPPWLRSYLGYLIAGSPEKPRKRPGRFGWKRREVVDFRVRYNLACLYCRLGAATAQSDRAFALAADQLRKSIEHAPLDERAALMKGAPDDPALKCLPTDAFKGLASDQPGGVHLI
ncbi:MAG TPA: hypothetical protein VHS74_13050 [Solirubrobacterales bacterium]|jgi:hypothetical protein|nr:hypothetical protein [Solirubrobacterales bacterium]